MSAEPSWDDTLTGRVAGARGQRPVAAAGRSDIDARHRSVHPDDEVERRTDWRLSAWLVCVVASCTAVLLGTGWAAGVTPGRAPAARPAAAPAGRTLLAVLTDKRGSATAAALVGVSGGRATCLLTPRQLAVDLPGKGQVSLQQAVLASKDDRRAARALSGALGVRVDDTWVLSGRRLSDLVDGVGGVDVDPDVRIRAGRVTEGEPTLHLDGRGAAGWTAAVPAGQRDDVRLARFYAVLDGALAGLPDDAAERDRALRAVYRGERTTLRRDRFVALISSLHEPARQEQVDDRVLPTVSAARGRYGVDAERYDDLLAGPLANVALPLGVVRVQLQPSPDAGGLLAQARDRLAAASLQVVAGEQQPVALVTGGGDRTTITVAGDDDRDKAEKVRTALGLPQAPILVRDLAGDAVDVVVQLGRDFSRSLESRSG